MALLITGCCVSLKASTLDRNFTLNLVDQSNILSTQLNGGIFIRARKAIQYKYYNNLLKYLERVSTKGFNDKYQIGDSYELMHNIYMLENLMFYFEKLEQYEKCAKIKEYVILLENCQVKA